ncbi:MAG TPA: ATP-dependent Clp protease proteolytic subunit [Pyrinomonadaceae bacterium]|nr:ATP-dependent Clp protease proteolytic subunit [Pyrinomonadaceae bacterium]
MISHFDDTIQSVLTKRLIKLEQHFESDVIFFYGQIQPGMEKFFRNFIEELKEEKRKENESKDRLVIFLNTPGGSAETVEKLVEIIRFHYQEVYFVVPDAAMSAGTIFCMSGDRIYMDYSSSLGPIDPQVRTEKGFVPALGYLDQVEKLLEKARNGTLTEAEFLILQKQDLAMLNQFEQVRNLTITLLKKWLVEYKFKDWEQHGTTPAKLGNPVTLEEKQERAEEIATLLGDNKIWHSHGRMISMATLQKVLRLKIEDYSNDETLRELIRSYNDLTTEYIAKEQQPFFFHSKYFF